MNRNPLVALLTTAALLALSGCGVNAANQLAAQAAARKAQATQAMAILRAEEQAIDASELKPLADKDWKLVEGTVTKLLPDDNNGSRHQHFLFKTREGKVIKTAHNIDLAPYVPVAVGDAVEVKCEYIRSKPNDVAHWTHYDPRGGEGGYIKHEGKVYDRLPEAK